MTTSLSLRQDTKTKTKAEAIRELRESFPHYAQALSGDNPPRPFDPDAAEYPSGKIRTYRLLATISALYAVICFLTWTSIVNSGESGMIVATIIQAVFFSIVAWILWEQGSVVRKRHEKTLPKIGPPHPMALVHFPFTQKIGGIEFTFLLEYEISTEFKQLSYKNAATNILSLVMNDTIAAPVSDASGAFHDLITKKFTLLAHAYLEQQFERYKAQSNPEQQSDRFGFAQLIDPNELEYYLAAPLGQAVYEASVPVFRYHVRLKYDTPAPELPTHNVVIGEVVPIKEIYRDGKVPDPWR